MIQTYLRWLRFSIIDFTGADRQYLIDAIAANSHRYPGFRVAVNARRDWTAEGRRYADPYTREYLQAIADRLAELEETEPHPDWDPKHCGM